LLFGSAASNQQNADNRELKFQSNYTFDWLKNHKSLIFK
jgi:hypothetical protein